MTWLAELAAPVAAFLLYTNAAVVAVQFHGVPFALAAGYLLLLLIPIGRDVLMRGLPLVVTPALVSVLALFSIAVVGALGAARPERAVAALQELALEEVLLYALFLNAIRTPKTLVRVVWALVTAGALLGGLVAFQHFTGAYENDFLGFAQLDQDGSRGFRVEDGPGAARQRRMAGPLGEPNRFAQIMTVLVPLAALGVYALRRGAARWLVGAALGLILLGGALAFSRGAAVGLALMLLVMLGMGYLRPRHLAGLGAAVLLVALLVPQYGQRLSSLGVVASLAGSQEGQGLSGADGATRGRLTEMLAAVLIFADHPIVGAGPGMYPEHYPEYARIAGGRVRTAERQAHSLPLQIAAEHGALGLTAFGMALFFTFRDLGRARRRWLPVRPELAHLTAGISLALVVYLTTSLFLHMSYARYFWFIFALAGAAGRLVPQEEESVLSRIVRVATPQRA